MSYLGSEFVIKDVKLRNRVVMPPLATEKSTSEGYITQELIGHYAKFAQTGVGMVIVEHAFISQQGKASPKQLGVSKDDMIQGLAQLAETIKAEGAVAIMQINHAGSACTSEVTGEEVVGASARPHPRNNEIMPRELTTNEMARIVEDFEAAAKRVEKAGFDGVEIHGAHGYLLNQFMSPLTNYRTDGYGGSRERLIAFPMDVADAVRNVIRPDMLLLYRLGANDMMVRGINLEDSIALAPRLQSIGVDLFDISGGMAGSRPSEMRNQDAYFAPMAGEIRKVVSEPVLVTGGITEPEVAEEVLANKKADLVGIGRELLRRPNWVKEALVSLE